jgi:hypothetical protein
LLFTKLYEKLYEKLNEKLIGITIRNASIMTLSIAIRPETLSLMSA